MRERVLAIVTFIAQYFLEEQETGSENDLVEELLAIGFEAHEIDAAFCWMENQALSPPQSHELTAPVITHRVFSREEQRALSPEARGFMIRLRGSGIIDEDTFEDIIQKSLQVNDEEVSLKDMKTIAVLTLFARSQHQWRQEFDCLLEDDWARLIH